MKNKLPIKLKKEPLIDAVFEIRYQASTNCSEIIPGILFNTLSGDINIESLPTKSIPKQILDSDPNLRHAPLVKITWSNFVVLIGDRSLAVACQMPYQGWTKFHAGINEVLNAVESINVIESIDRFSMKYVDLIQSDNISDQISFINTQIKIGNHEVKREIFSLKVEVPKDDLLHVIQIASSAIATSQHGETLQGIIVEVDSIANTTNLPFIEWRTKSNDLLDDLHQKNKEMFFECLNKSTIEQLEPEYE